MIGLEVDGIEGLLKDLKSYGKDTDNAVMSAVADTARAIERDAKSRIRENVKRDAKPRERNSRLFASIGRMKKYEDNKFEAVVGTDVTYAPYVEFGTGEKVFTNSEFDDEARKVAALFKGKKKVSGMRGFSFLNYAAVKNSKKFIEALTKRLNAIR